jgi:hypothetical protein
MKWLRLTIPLALLIILLAIIKDDAGRFLVVNEPPHRADAIIVIDGGASEELGIKYFHLGYAPYLLLTRAPSMTLRIIISPVLKSFNIKASRF